MFLTLLIGLCYLENAYGGDGECKHAKPLENFSMKNYAGDWFVAATEGFDETTRARFAQFSCKKLKLSDSENPDTKVYKWSVDIPAGEQEIENDGTYYLNNSNVGFMKVNFLNIPYDYYVLCTDYTSWATTYGCAQISPGHNSEVAFLYVRDYSKIDEITNKEEVKHCYKDVLTSNQMLKFPQNHCPA